MLLRGMGVDVISGITELPEEEIRVLVLESGTAAGAGYSG
jgi:hypothetical protein